MDVADMDTRIRLLETADRDSMALGSFVSIQTVTVASVLILFRSTNLRGMTFLTTRGGLELTFLLAEEETLGGGELEQVQQQGRQHGDEACPASVARLFLELPGQGGVGQVAEGAGEHVDEGRGEDDAGAEGARGLDDGLDLGGGLGRERGQAEEDWQQHSETTSGHVGKESADVKAQVVVLWGDRFC